MLGEKLTIHGILDRYDSTKMSLDQASKMIISNDIKKWKKHSDFGKEIREKKKAYTGI